MGTSPRARGGILVAAALGLLGSPLAMPRADTAPAFAAFPIENPEPIAGAGFGAAVAGVDDLDGDGVGDLAVGAPATTG